MAFSSLAQTIIVEEPCEFEYRDGLVYVSYASVGIALVFRRHVFYANFHAAAQCMQDCHAAASAEIIEFPRAAHS